MGKLLRVILFYVTILGVLGAGGAAYFLWGMPQRDINTLVANAGNFINEQNRMGAYGSRGFKILCESRYKEAQNRFAICDCLVQKAESVKAVAVAYAIRNSFDETKLDFPSEYKGKSAAVEAEALPILKFCRSQTRWKQEY